MLKSVFIFFGLLLSSVPARSVDEDRGRDDVSVDNESVTEAAKEATKELNRMLNAEYHTKLARVLHARMKVSAGIYYKLKFVIGLTNCKKSKVNAEDIEDVENCEFQDSENTYHKCEALVFWEMNYEYKTEDFVCELTSRDNL